MKSARGKFIAFLIIFTPPFLLLAANGGIEDTVLLPLLVFGIIFIAIQKIPLVSNLYLISVTAIPLLNLLYKLCKAVYDLFSDTKSLNILWMPALSALLLLSLAMYCISGITLGHIRDIRSGK